jgi:signal transduction histidine kinase
MRRRLLLSYLTITVLVLVGLEVPLGISFARSERRRLEQSVHQDAMTLAVRSEEALEAPPEPGSAQELMALVQRYEGESGDRVVIVDAAGQVLASSEPAGEGTSAEPGLLGPPEIARALAGHESSGSRYSSELGAELWYTAIPVRVGSNVAGAVRVTHTTTAVSHRIRDNWLLLAAIGGSVLAIVSLVSFLVARSVTRPLADLGRAASRLGAGALNARAPVPTGPSEVRLLAQEFNTTAAQLEELVGAQHSFVADASHQLRTPLSALRLRLENLESEVDPSAADDVEGARAEVDRLTRLVDGLMTLARAEQLASAPTDVDLAAIVAGRRDAWLAFAAERDVRLEAEVEAGLWARATPERLEQVLDNLLNNALEVAPPATIVTISAAARRDRVELRIRDAGPGMSSDERARAFDRFWRAPGSPADNGGFGLGLAIVRQLVATDGGTVELRSPPSGGLEAAITLRTGRRPAAPSPAAEPPSLSGPSAPET